jgi:hypothetical protein
MQQLIGLLSVRRLGGLQQGDGLGHRAPFGGVHVAHETLD